MWGGTQEGRKAGGEEKGSQGEKVREWWQEDPDGKGHYEVGPLEEGPSGLISFGEAQRNMEENGRRRPTERRRGNQGSCVP